MSDPSDLVGVTIDGRTWKYWDDIEITRALDSYSTCGFSAPFEAERGEFRATFKPFSFKPLAVTVGDRPLFTGTMVDVNPEVEAGSRIVKVSGYSRPGVLERSHVPARITPFESTGLSLMQIAQRLTAPFGISVVSTADVGSAFKRVHTKSKKVDSKAGIEEKVQDFLAELAKQRGLVISSTEKGELLFQKSIAPGKPVARLEEGKAPVMTVVPTYTPEEYYSEITGYRDRSRRSRGSVYTALNERLAGGALRSLSFRLNDIEKGDAPAAVKARLARMFANALRVVVTVPTWRDPKGALWAPNTTLKLKAPDALLYRETEFLMRDVILRQSAGEKTASLGLVLPGAFTGEVPKSLPWDEDDAADFIDTLVRI